MAVYGARSRSKVVMEAAIPYPSTRPEDMGWNSTSLAVKRRKQTGRDLPNDVQGRSIALSFAAYRMNPLAHRLIELQINFVLGHGVTLNSNNPEFMAWLLEYWTNSYNAWPKKAAARLRDYYIYGEWLHSPMYDKARGMTYLGDLQPDAIVSIHPDTYSVSEPDIIVLRTDSVQRKDREFKMIRRRITPVSWNLTPPSGDLHHFAMGKTSDSMRGVGVLFPIIDMVDAYDDILFSRAEKIRAAGKIYWDLKMTGYTEDQIRDYLSKETNVPPAPGTLYAHNENAELNILTPDMKADDLAVDTSNIKSFVVSSLGWPGTWFDDPGDAGRAVGAEMAEPSIKLIISLQTEFLQMLLEETNYAALRAINDGTLAANESYKGDDDWSIQRIPDYSITCSNPSARDFQRLGPALARFGTFLGSLAERKVITQEEMRAMVAHTINQLDLSAVPLTLAIPNELPTALPEIADAAIDRAQQEIDLAMSKANLDQKKQDMELAKKAAAMPSVTMNANGKTTVKEAPQR